MGTTFHFFVDVEDFPVGSDVKSPAVGERASWRDNTVRLGNGFSRVTEDRIIQVETLCEFCIGTRCITACCKIGNVEFL